jgi:signal transduction histidine kinase
MRLLDKYNRISLMITVMVIVVTGFVYYFTISYILTGQVDQDLLVEEHEIFDYVKSNQKLPQVFKSENLKIHFEQIGKDTVQRKFVDINYPHSKENDMEAGRELISTVHVKGAIYRISIVESKVETEDLIRLIFFITLGIILLLIVALVIINRLVIRNLWKPFYDILQQIKLFNLTDTNGIATTPTEIDEFKDMNQEISAMSARVRQDYRELKNFVENASHELMTPIAVMNSKLDTLIQTSDLTERQGELIGDVYNTVAKLTRLNKAMLLLTKIENKLIAGQEQISVKQAIDNTLSEFQEILAAKNLQLHLDLSPTDQTLSKTLLDILLNNLLSNAVRHNLPGGDIYITLKQQALSIQNTGKPDALDGDTIFQRFQKSAESEGSGLGLTLARQICENYGLTLTYEFKKDLHTFTVEF